MGKKVNCGSKRDSGGKHMKRIPRMKRWAFKATSVTLLCIARLIGLDEVNGSSLNVDEVNGSDTDYQVLNRISAILHLKGTNP